MGTCCSSAEQESPKSGGSFDGVQRTRDSRRGGSGLRKKRGAKGGFRRHSRRSSARKSSFAGSGVTGASSGPASAATRTAPQQPDAQEPTESHQLERDDRWPGECDDEKEAVEVKPLHSTANPMLPLSKQPQQLFSASHAQLLSVHSVTAAEAGSSGEALRGLPEVEGHTPGSPSSAASPPAGVPSGFPGGAEGGGADDDLSSITDSEDTVEEDAPSPRQAQVAVPMPLLPVQSPSSEHSKRRQRPRGGGSRDERTEGQLNNDVSFCTGNAGRGGELVDVRRVGTSVVSGLPTTVTTIGIRSLDDDYPACSPFKRSAMAPLLSTEGSDRVNGTGGASSSSSDEGVTLRLTIEAVKAVPKATTAGRNSIPEWLSWVIPPPEQRQFARTPSVSSTASRQSGSSLCGQHISTVGEPSGRTVLAAAAAEGPSSGRATREQPNGRAGGGGGGGAKAAVGQRKGGKSNNDNDDGSGSGVPDAALLAFGVIDLTEGGGGDDDVRSDAVSSTKDSEWMYNLDDLHGEYEERIKKKQEKRAEDKHRQHREVGRTAGGHRHGGGAQQHALVTDTTPSHVRGTAARALQSPDENGGGSKRRKRRPRSEATPIKAEEM